MDIFTFRERFPDEESCASYLKHLRWPDTNFTCPECGSHDHADHEFRQMSQCSNCGRQVYWKAGTLFENSNLDLQTWFWGIYLMVESKKGISRLKLSRRLGVSYGTATRMANRIQILMVESEQEPSLEGVVKLDIGQYEPPHSGADSPLPNDQVPVFVACEVEPSRHKDEKYDHPPIRRVMLTPAINKSKPAACDFIEQHIKPGSHIKTDKGTNFVNLDLDDYSLETTNLSHLPDGESIADYFPWVHILIGNNKRQLLGTHHGVDPLFLKSYLSEFTFRMNHWDEQSIFDRFLHLAVETDLGWKKPINAKAA